MMPYVNILGAKIASQGIAISLGLITGLLYLYDSMENRSLFHDRLLLLFVAFVFGSILSKVVGHMFFGEALEFRGVVRRGSSVFGFEFGFLGIALLVSQSGGISLSSILKEFLIVGVPMQAFGKIGCFFAGCCYGVPFEYGIPFYHPLSAATPGLPLLPIQLLSSIVFVSAWLVLMNRPRFMHPVLYVAGYGVYRAIEELFRGDSRVISDGLRIYHGQFLGFLLFFVASSIWYFEVIHTNKFDYRVESDEN